MSPSRGAFPAAGTTLAIRPGPGVREAMARIAIEHDLDDPAPSDAVMNAATDAEADASPFWHARHVPDLVWAMRAALGALVAEIGRGDWPREVAVGVSLRSDQEMRELNREWRNKDRPTNVLSWPAADLEPGDAPPPYWGDLAFAYGTVEREAKEEGWPFDAYLARLALHGALHCLGHDHETSPLDAARMEALEARILARIGLPDPYEGTEPL